MAQQRPRRPGHNYWFPARKYGWGWGLPSTWQGWFVLDIYIIGMTGLLAFCFVLNSHPGMKSFLYFLILGGGFSYGLYYVCREKGEPQRARKDR